MHATHPHMAPIEELNAFVDALIAGDNMTCEAITEQALSQHAEIPTLYQGLFQPALYRVGELWAANRIGVAVEHMATAITEGLLNRVYPRLVNPRRAGRKALIAIVQGELHQVGGKMVADMFEMQGWDAVFPGAGLDTDEVLALIGHEAPELLGLSISVSFHADRLVSMVEGIRRAHPDLPILIGGQGLDELLVDELGEFPGLTCVRSLDALVPIIRAHAPA